MKKSDNKPIVSIIVVTYNSSNYVLETLESIKAQTYPYLSLIITDDCSTDKTVLLCKKWIHENKERFVETTILESLVNTGVSANMNRGEKICKTEWVKEIAGDDILMPNCVEDNIGYVSNHSNVDILFSKNEAFGVNQRVTNIYGMQFDYGFFYLSREEQLERLIFEGNCIPASTCFLNINNYRKLGLSNDERIPMLEDWPKWINSIKKGANISYMDKTTVRYRVRKNSLSTSPIISAKYFHSLRLFYYYYQRENFIKRYGAERTIEIEMDLWMKIYSDYYFYRTLFVSKVYFMVTHLLQKAKRAIIGLN